MENDRRLREVQQVARGLNPEDDEINRRTREQVTRLREAAADLREFTDRFEKEILTDELEPRRDEPTAHFEFTEAELVDGLEVLKAAPANSYTTAADRFFAKLSQGLRIESGPGGKFRRVH